MQSSALSSSPWPGSISAGTLSCQTGARLGWGGLLAPTTPCQSPKSIGNKALVDLGLTPSDLLGGKRGTIKGKLAKIGPKWSRARCFKTRGLVGGGKGS